MRKFAILAFALAACGGDSKQIPTPVDSLTPDTAPPPDTEPPPPDAQVLDLSCMANQTPPTTATATVTASGAANGLDITLVNGQPSPQVAVLDEADIDVCINDCTGNNDILDSTSSSALPCGMAGCDFTTAALDTLNAPINAFLKVSKQGFRTTNIFPPEPIRADLMNVPALAMTTGAFELLSTFLGGGRTKGTGAALVIVNDCAQIPAAAAVLSVKQGGVEVATVTIVNAGDLAAQLAGTFFVFNIPTGATTFGATVDGTTFRPHDVLVFDGELTATQVTPGFAAP